MGSQVGESLPPESINILQYLHEALPKQLTDQLKARKHLKCTGNVSSWADVELEEHHAIMNPFGQGFHLDRAAFEQLVRESVEDVPNIENPRGSLVRAGFKSAEKDADGLWDISATIDEESIHFRCRWLIDATGRKASLATSVCTGIIIVSFTNHNSSLVPKSSNLTLFFLSTRFLRLPTQTTTIAP